MTTDNASGGFDGTGPEPPPDPQARGTRTREDRYNAMARLYQESGFAFHDEYQEALNQARRPVPRRTRLTPALVDRAADELERGAWPRDLWVMLNVPEGTWRSWMARGEEAANAADQSDESEAAEREIPDEPDERALAAELYLVVGRSRAAIERVYRRAVVNLAAAGNPGWKAAVWLLARFSPQHYNEQVEARTEEAVTKILAAVRDADDVSADDYERLVRALERARADRLGAC